jgi:hypothetical protein
MSELRKVVKEFKLTQEKGEATTKPTATTPQIAEYQ